MINNLNSIKVFYHVAKNLSFKDAANELALTPTAVSHQIKNLENDLGIKLFIRKTRMIELTKEGEILFKGAEKSLQAIDQSLGEINKRKNVISISTTMAFASHCLIPYLDSFEIENPQYEIEIYSSNKLESSNMRGDIDLFIRFGPIPNKDVIILKKEKLRFFISNHAYEKALKSKCILQVEWENKSLEVQQTPSLKGFNKVKKFRSEEHALKAAINGQGVLFCSETICQNDLENNILKYFNTKKHLETDYYYYLTTKKKGRKIEDFKRWISGILN
ncbi:LysR family transcriptional regulator [Halobacteriovorax sp. CON-3]|uniref:LysR family transcriptional regulator n=1 Tax=Halobacteriovorax sp. CON-3 TaxID=3157710 RepID=UPI0037152BC5